MPKIESSYIQYDLQPGFDVRHDAANVFSSEQRPGVDMELWRRMYRESSAAATPEARQAVLEAAQRTLSADGLYLLPQPFSGFKNPIR